MLRDGYTTIGVDFDRTLVSRPDRLVPVEEDGEPVWKNVRRVQLWLKQGIEVVIFTGRLHPVNGEEDIEESKEVIREFCRTHFGRELEMTCMKSPTMGFILDDMAYRSERNTGEVPDFEFEDPLDGDDPAILKQMEEDYAQGK